MPPFSTGAPLFKTIVAHSPLHHTRHRPFGFPRTTSLGAAATVAVRTAPGGGISPRAPVFPRTRYPCRVRPIWGFAIRGRAGKGCFARIPGPGMGIASGGAGGARKWGMNNGSGNTAMGPVQDLPPRDGEKEQEEKKKAGASGTQCCCNGSAKLQETATSSKLLTIPTLLTLGRVAAVPLLVSTFYIDNQWSAIATTSIFLAAAITDWLDGYIARKMRLGTAFGAFLDPVADKLMVAATLVMLCTKPLDSTIFGHVPWLLTVPSIAIIGREITMSAVREWAASQNSKVLEAVAVNNLGKWKTATQMTALTILLAARDASVSASALLVTSGVVLLYISAWLAVWSLAVYMRKIWRVLLR